MGTALAELSPDSEVSSTTARTVIELSCDQVIARPDQPRKHFNKQKLEGLAKLIEKSGQLAPILVRQLGPDMYQIVDGERRWRACTILGRKVRAIVIDVKEEEIFTQSVAANHGREEHNDVEIMQAIVRLQNIGTSIEDICVLFGGKSVPWAYSHLKLRHLHPKVLEMMSPELPENQRLGFSIAVEIASKPQDQQLMAAQNVIDLGLSLKQAKHMFEKEGLHTGNGTNIVLRVKERPDRAFAGFADFFSRLNANLALTVDKSEEILDLTLAGGNALKQTQLIVDIKKARELLEQIRVKVEQSFERQATASAVATAKSGETATAASN